jgi:septum formation protein
MGSDMRIILASASPRRKVIMSDLGIDFDVVIPEVDEVHWDNDPTGTVEVNARRKCEAVSAAYPDAAVIAADTVVVLDGVCLGKPDSMPGAEKMLLSFSGKLQVVYSGVAMQAPGREIDFELARSEVRFRVMSEELVREYFKLVYPLDRAGAYDVNEHSELIIDSFSGSRTNIMGLPRKVVSDWLQRL